MFDGLFKNRARQQRQLRSQAAELLLRRLEQEQTLVMDDALFDAFKIGRRALFRIAYDLVVKERMHILSDAEGRVLLLANAEFRRFMMRRSGVPEEEIRREKAATAVQTAEEDSIALDWFTLDVAPPRAKAGKMPAKRQSLPDRVRDPWSVMEGAGLD